MKIYFWNIRPNFGDLLNPWLWPKIFPNTDFGTCAKIEKGIVDAGHDSLLVGIGTLINQNFPKAKQSIVVGSGVGYGEPPTFGQNVKIYCVRGPRSAAKLLLPESKGIIDPGVLVKDFYNSSEAKVHRFSYMPQISSIMKSQGFWQTLCEQLDYGYIDPRDAVDVSLKKIAETEVLLTESMHGAIVAEAIGVPWIPIVTRKEILSFKWKDWCDSIEVEYRPVRVTSIDEPTSPSFKQKLKRFASQKLAARQLRRAAKTEPTQANESVVDNKIAMLKDVLGTIQQNEFSKANCY